MHLSKNWVKMRQSEPLLLTCAATALIVIPACAATPPARNPATNAAKELSAGATSTKFPASLSDQGERYDRLTGTALERAVRGKTFCPSPACSGVDGSVSVFQNDGTYLIFGDRWDDGGRYAIVNDVVVVKLADAVRQYAFYRSRSGSLQQAWENRAGKIESSKVFTK